MSRLIKKGIYLLLFLLSGLDLYLAAPSNNSNAIECGMRPLVGYPTSRIVGGKTAVRGSWPWQVSLQFYNTTTRQYVHFCGASVITRTWLLSAAHCFNGLRSESSWRAVAGLHTLYVRSVGVDSYAISRIIIKSNFNIPTYRHDIALLRLQAPIKYNDFIQPICLPNFADPGNKLPCFISGWGALKERGHPSPDLLEAQVDLIPREICNQDDWYAGVIGEGMICAGFESGGIDACQGDSGGPFACFIQDQKRFYQLGIISFGKGCAAPKRPGVYTYVHHYKNWIDDVIARDDTNHVVYLLPLILLTVAKAFFFYFLIGAG
ncbi:transmembrane protease serine 12-like [Ambystoma mexicanum]|uniref:transmembrane protease serine 12-like n=1 Tax=Ambystoma mexicanum TaxID=8296 RepID=UPI0037E8D611